MIAKIFIGVLAVVIISATLFFFSNKRRNNEPIVLGKPFTNALVKDQERQKMNPNVASPMPEKKYNRQKGQWDLLNPKPSELDTILRELCANFTGKTKQEQSEFRSAITLDEFYTLIEFARRSAVFALRSKDHDILNDGLTSIAMIDAERIDFRDLLSALALLHHSATRIGVNPPAMFTNAAKFATPGTSKLITGFTQRDPNSLSLRDSWGYCEADTDYGVGFARWGFETYNPSLDLLEVAIMIASTIEKDAYFADSIELATDLPSVWLETPKSKNLPQTLKKITGGVTVSFGLEDEKHPDAGNQQFTLFMVELDEPESAQVLLKMSLEKEPKDYCMLGFSRGKLFALLIARSVMVGVDSFETNDSIKRFIIPIDTIIQESGH